MFASCIYKIRSTRTEQPLGDISRDTRQSLFQITSSNYEALTIRRE